jgi:hypothetical protein
MSRRWRALVTLTALVVVGGAGLWGGMWLGERASQPEMRVLSLDRPSTVAPREAGVRSAAGFSGFEAGALGGAVSRSGTASPSGDGQLVIESASARAEVQYANASRFFAIDAASRAPQSGDVVVVRLTADGVAEAVLLVPGDIREGDAR